MRSGSKNSACSTSVSRHFKHFNWAELININLLNFRPAAGPHALWPWDSHHAGILPRYNFFLNFSAFSDGFDHPNPVFFFWLFRRLILMGLTGRLKVTYKWGGSNTPTAVAYFSRTWAGCYEGVTPQFEVGLEKPTLPSDLGRICIFPAFFAIFSAFLGKFLGFFRRFLFGFWVVGSPVYYARFFQLIFSGANYYYFVGRPRAAAVPTCFAGKFIREGHRGDDNSAGDLILRDLILRHLVLRV
jgi:hypothetical protein